jgi:hypothetical protein
MLKAPKRASKQFQIASEGEHPVVLAAVQDLGIVYNEKSHEECRRIRFIWLLGDEIEDETGNALLVLQSMNLKLTRSPMSKLYQTLLEATGAPPHPDTDFETLVGLQARLVVVHRQGDEKVFANVDRMMRPEPGQKVEIPVSFWPPKVYRRDSESGPESAPAVPPRKTTPAQLEIPGSVTQPEISDDDIPF